MSPSPLPHRSPTMNTSLPLVALALALGVGCSSTQPSSEPAAPAAAPATAAPAATTDHDSKTAAPVDMSLVVSGKTGRVTATLELRSRADLKGGAARFVLPSGVTFVSGDREIDLGAIKNGESRKIQIVIDVPERGSFLLAAGVDAQISQGIKLNKSQTAQLGGDIPADGSTVVRTPSGGGLRIAK